MLRPDTTCASIRKTHDGVDIYYKTLPLNDRLVSGIVLGPGCASNVANVSELVKTSGFRDVVVGTISDAELE